MSTSNDNRTVGERLYPVPDIEDVELRNLTDRFITGGIPESVVMNIPISGLLAMIAVFGPQENEVSG